MTEGTRYGAVRTRRGPTANERFKERWSTRLAWSIVAATALHACLLGIRPDWRASPETSALSDEPRALEWIPLSRLPEGGRVGPPSAAVPVGRASDSTAAEGDFDPSSAADRTRMAAGTEALRDRLFGADAPVPTVTAPEPEPAPDETSGSEADSAALGARASTAEIPEQLDRDELDLDRLSALRPELSYGAASNWVLIRNPIEVERFMRRTAYRRNLEVAGETSVSVTLWIDETGSVEWAEIHESSGRSELDKLALSLFSDVAAFRPARDEGVRIPKSVIFTVHFPW